LGEKLRDERGALEIGDDSLVFSCGKRRGFFCLNHPKKAAHMRPRETEHNTASGQAGSAHLVSLIVCVLAISSAGMIVSQTDDPPIRIQPRDKPHQSGKETTQLPEITPGPKRSDRDVEHKAPQAEDKFPAATSLASEIHDRKTMRFWLSRTTTASLENSNDRISRYVNPSNFENHEIKYTSAISLSDQLTEIEFWAPWQFLSKYQKETIRYPLSKKPFAGVYRRAEIGDLCNKTREYSLSLTRQSLLHAYSGRDNLFQKDPMLRLGRNVPEALLEKMKSSNIDEQLLEMSPLNDKDGPCEIVTILWLTGLLDKINEPADPSSSADDKIEILIDYSPRTGIYQEGIYSAVSSQIFLTAIRSTFEPGVIHICLIDFEVKELKKSTSGVVPGYRYQIQKTWSIGTLQ